MGERKMQEIPKKIVFNTPLYTLPLRLPVRVERTPIENRCFVVATGYVPADFVHTGRVSASYGSYLARK